MNQTPEILIPEKAAAYLQIDRETVYRYIRDGKLVASKLGHTYRIPKRSIDLLLWPLVLDRISLYENTLTPRLTPFLRLIKWMRKAKALSSKLPNLLPPDDH
jgi:excisionase family DNA binding protein